MSASIPAKFAPQKRVPSKAAAGTDSKHQVRTKETQAKLLDAAEGLFSEKGFEMTQLEEVAARAGFTRGAIYAHYASKEDLFLALVNQRVVNKLSAMRTVILAESEVSRRPAVFRRWLVAQAGDRAWGILMLEFKLYALRRPESRNKLMSLYDLIAESSASNLIEILFGDSLGKEQRKSMERRLAVGGAVMSAVNLESHFRPKLLAPRNLEAVLEALFDALIRI